MLALVALIEPQRLEAEQQASELKLKVGRSQTTEWLLKLAIGEQTWLLDFASEIKQPSLFCLFNLSGDAIENA